MNPSSPDGSAAAATQIPATPVLGRRAVALVGTLLLGVISYQLNASMITPALPDMARELGEDLAKVSQVSSLFFLAGAIGGVVLTRWSDFFGRKQTLVAILVLLGVGSILCIFASSLPVLLAGRVLQGASSAAFQLAYVILKESLPARLFGTTLGVITSINGGVGGIDGWIGGALSDAFGYRSIFVVILLVGLIAVPCVYLVVPKSPPPIPAGRMDWWGAGVLSLVLVCMSYFVSSGSTAGWTAPRTLLYFAGTVVTCVAFWYVEKRGRSPLIAVQHLRSRQVWPVIVTTVLTLAGIFAVINFTVVLLSQDGTEGFGLNAADSALLFLTPPALIGALASPLSGWLAGRRGWIRFLRYGLIGSIALLVVISLMPHHKWVVFSMIALLGITYNGLVLTTINGLGVLLSPKSAPAALPGLNGAGFGIGAGLGIGIVAPFAAPGTAAGYSTALWISVGITVLALLASLFITPPKGQTL